MVWHFILLVCVCVQRLYRVHRVFCLFFCAAVHGRVRSFAVGSLASFLVEADWKSFSLCPSHLPEARRQVDAHFIILNLAATCKRVQVKKNKKSKKGEAEEPTETSTVFFFSFWNVICYSGILKVLATSCWQVVVIANRSCKVMFLNTTQTFSKSNLPTEGECS